MSLPRILIVDDQYARDPVERALVLKRAGLADLQAATSPPEPIEGFVADAVICGGQRTSGNAVVNDYTTIADAIRSGERGEGGWSLVLLDVRFDSGVVTDSGPSGQPGDDEFGELVRDRLAKEFEDLPVVVLTGKKESELTKQAGPYLSKYKLGPREIRRTLVHYGRLTAPQTQELLGLDSNHVIASRRTLDVYATALSLAASLTPVLLVGESGTGKERLARFLHDQSPRKDRTFVPVNASAIPRELLEAELFGNEKGAYTGASVARPGYFRLASGGTLFLDEIGDLPIELQPKLLRVLQDGEIQPVGGRLERVDVRIVSATHRDLDREVAEGRFREDLLYRVRGRQLTLPPLRERGDEIVPLARQFLAESSDKEGKAGIELSHEAIELLESHPFPGNVRELENLVSSLVSTTGHNQVITAAAIRPLLGRESGPLSATAPVPARRSRDPVAIALTDLPGLLASVKIPKDGDELIGIRPRLHQALSALIRRLAGAALERSRHPVSRKFNLSAAVRLLTGDESVTPTGAVRTLNQVLGRKGKRDSPPDAALEDLVSSWREVDS